MNAPVKIETTLKDWETDQEVRWCPGCGDYAKIGRASCRERV